MRLHCGSSDRKKNVNISWDVRQSSLVARTACGPQHIFTFVILSGCFVMKIRTWELDASESIGNSWQNAQFRKSLKCESDQNDQKVKMFKSIGNSWQNSQEDVLKRISSSRQKIASDQISRRRHIIYNKYYYNRRALRVIFVIDFSTFFVHQIESSFPLQRYYS